jgi:protein-tyrosine-phosphatase
MKYVLFVCTHNAGRSQIAQAFFEHYAPRRPTCRISRPGARGRDLAKRRRSNARNRHRHLRPHTKEDRS